MFLYVLVLQFGFFLYYLNNLWYSDTDQSKVISLRTSVVDPDPIGIQGFDDKKWNLFWSKNAIYLSLGRDSIYRYWYDGTSQIYNNIQVNVPVD